jgi:UDP-N-acetylmuramyl pentapeptide phosphotransferase/UDP-N-acetylglucosamine-1-phosphate transferase
VTDPLTIAGLAALALAASWIGTGAVLAWLEQRRIVDVPNQRSSHSRPIPRGGGIGLLLGILPALILYAMMSGEPRPWLFLVAGALGLALVSWIDDLGHIAARWRLLAQAAAVALGLHAIGDAPVFQGLLPRWLDLALSGIAWVWFVNLTNFMDGIDGITGVEAVAIGLGIAVLGAAPAPALIIAAAALGFLRWNWHPARLFMGDVGSVPLGYLLGGLLLLLAKSGHWAPALILPAYYLADATWTLLRRLVAGKRVWEAHREHFYQLAVQRGRSHAWVAGAVGAANLGLVALAYAGLAVPWTALAGAALLVAALLLRLSRA